jgi:hypothetical protein
MALRVMACDVVVACWVRIEMDGCVRAKRCVPRVLEKERREREGMRGDWSVGLLQSTMG